MGSERDETVAMQHGHDKGWRANYVSRTNSRMDYNASNIGNPYLAYLYCPQGDRWKSARLRRDGVNCVCCFRSFIYVFGGGLTIEACRQIEICGMPCDRPLRLGNVADVGGYGRSAPVLVGAKRSFRD